MAVVALDAALQVAGVIEVRPGIERLGDAGVARIIVPHARTPIITAKRAVARIQERSQKLQVSAEDRR